MSLARHVCWVLPNDNSANSRLEGKPFAANENQGFRPVPDGTRLALVHPMNDVAHLALGGALVMVGVVAAAIAERIRGVRPTRDSAPRGVATTIPKAVATRDTSIASDDAQQEVIGALVSAGYPKRVATAAASRCTPEQRTTTETWMRAALRRCAQAEV